ncbi:GNAT family N-acetyltransferase [Roseburia porci]|uniref:GNAT family N-acetyltransferase n=1 Tax=Roseburia porci TaxID=2605790 RepID=UPI0038CD1A10
MHEIFVLKSFRGKGVAFSAVSKIMEMYKGKYRVEQLKENTSAIKFWKRFYHS